jgi:3'(2'),5'-bisphosphate nucleotidase
MNTAIHIGGSNIQVPMTQEPHSNLIADDLDLDKIAEIFAELAVEAGAAIMRFYGTDAHAKAKPDQSPVCDADLAAESVILRGLKAALPQLPVVSEEAVAAGNRPSETRIFILVDPLDGTREFLSRNGEFTVNLALIVDAVPRAGVVYAPAAARIWIAGENAAMASVLPGERLPPKEERQLLRTRRAPVDGLVALASRSHSDAQTEAFLARLPIKERQSAGSSLKFCRVAEGAADVYPRFGRTMEWDTAAGDAVLRRAGGIVNDAAGKPSRYGKFADGLANGPFVAWGDPAAASQLSSE